MLAQLIQLTGIDESALREIRGKPLRRSDPVVRMLMDHAKQLARRRERVSS